MKAKVISYQDIVYDKATYKRTIRKAVVIYELNIEKPAVILSMNMFDALVKSVNKQRDGV